MKKHTITFKTMIDQYSKVLFFVFCGLLLSKCSKDNEIDLCSNVVCQNDGTCIDGVCDCPEGYSGEFCEIDLCSNVVCQNDGTCIDGVCDCPEGYSGEFCEIEMQSSLTLQTAYGSINTLEVVTDDIFAIWWDPKFNHESETNQLFQWLKEIRADVKTNLGMADPPNTSAGFYFNVYIHHGADDLFPNEWSNGVGTDKYGLPYFAIPNGYHDDYENILHEGFHIFQYSGVAITPGFAYAGDSKWYVEASANWYRSLYTQELNSTFGLARVIEANSQLSLWHSSGNEAPGDPTDWTYQVRQYGMNLYLYFLTHIKDVDFSIITNGFYSQTNLNPQNYLFQQVGESLRSYYADWAAHNAGGFDYITVDQLEFSQAELDQYGDPNNVHPYINELTDDEANGTFSPPTNLKPRGWSYNVIKINNSEAATYSFDITGDATGSEGATSHFEGRIVVIGTPENRYVDITMNDGLSGTGSVVVDASENEIYLVVTSVPEHFTGNQTYDYSVDITRN